MPNRLPCRCTPVATLALSLALFLAACASPDRHSPGHQPIRVTIVHTNDSHSRLSPFPDSTLLSATTAGPQQGGVARRKALIDEIRAGEANLLLFDAGDNFQGTIFYNAWRGSAEVMALNALGYDAITLGNHEFDLGPAELGRALRGEPVAIDGTLYPTERLRVPVVASNVDASTEPALAGLWRQSLIIERGGEQFGILGMVNEETATASSPGANLHFTDYLTTVQAAADRLAEQGVNKIILLSHAGYWVDLLRASELQGVDLIVSGHDHTLLGDPAAIEAVAPGMGEKVAGPYPTVVTARDGKPVLLVSAHDWGRWLGRLTVDFDARGVASHWQGEPIFLRGCEFVAGAVDCHRQRGMEDPAVTAQVAAYRRPVDIFAGAVVGTAGIFFEGRRLPGLRSQEMPLGNLIADLLLTSAGRSDRAVAALVNSGGIRAGIDQGEVTYEEALAVLPFGNTVVVVESSGETILAALDHGLARQGEAAFPQVAGMAVDYCATLPCPEALRPGGVVRHLAIAGQPLDPAANYRLATNSFLAGGGDGYSMLATACADGSSCRDTGILELDLLVGEFTAASPVVRTTGQRLVAH